MRSSTLLLCTIGTAMALPSGSFDVCGPGSNCERVTNRHGRDVIRFKEGMGPGSKDYIRRFGNDAEKLHRRDDVTTHVTIGDTEIGYYCGEEDAIKVRDYVVNALNTLCSDTGCDEGSDWTVPSQYVKDDSFDSAQVTITAEGTYPSGWMVHFVDAIGVIPENGAVTTKEMTYFTWGAVPKQDSCIAKRMANYAKVAKFDGIDLVGSIDFTAKLDIDDSSGKSCSREESQTFTLRRCLLTYGNPGACELVNTILGAITGAVSGIAGGFFGVVGTLCSGSD